jgi:hypothetical protein
MQPPLQQPGSCTCQAQLQWCTGQNGLIKIDSLKLMQLSAGGFQHNCSKVKLLVFCCCSRWCAGPSGLPRPSQRLRHQHPCCLVD